MFKNPDDFGRARMHRFYKRFDSQDLFDRVSTQALALLDDDPTSPVTVSMDDSILRRGGNHTHGVAWRKDPLGPPFNINFVRGQRMLQLSLCVPSADGSARSIPVDFQHTPTPKKPRKNAPEADWIAYKQQVKATNINIAGVEGIARLRQRVGTGRQIHLCVDGRFTNGTIFKNLPEDTTLIGRIRKDAVLHHPVDDSERARTGRRKIYGEKAPTPEELRKDDSVPWISVRAFAAGKHHDFKIKRLGPIKWRKAGGESTMQIVVVAPLKYKLRKKGDTLYRQPAYLICTDPALDLQNLLQAYLRRWDIEVNFRDEKTLLGLGQAQVRTEASTQNVPAIGVAAYSMLLIASIKAFGQGGYPPDIPTPKWQAKKTKARASTMALIDQLRFDLWACSLKPQSFSHFSPQPNTSVNHQKLKPSLVSSLFTATA